MKKLLLLIITTFVSWNVINAQKSELTIDIQTPGLLSSMINYADQISIESIKVTGYINKEDLKFIGYMISERSLKKHIDLSEVNIIGEKSEDDNILKSGSSFSLSKVSEINFLSLPHNLKNSEGGLGGSLLIDTLEVGGKSLHKITNCMFSGSNRYDSGISSNSTIKNIIIREGVDSICNDAFYSSIIENSRLKSIKFPSSLKYIGDYAFYKCKELSNIYFSDSLKVIGKKAFSECEKLSDINLPNSITEIKEYAFNETNFNPDTLILPRDLKSIHLTAFNKANVITLYEDIEKIDNVYTTYNRTFNTWDSHNFYSDNLVIHIKDTTPPLINIYDNVADGGPMKKFTVYVPKGSYSAYKSSKYKPEGYSYETTNPWSYATIIEESVYVTSLKLNINNANIKVGETLTLSTNIYPENADNKSVNYISEDENIAYVNSTGVITGKKRGVTKIIVTSKENNNISDTCIVNIIQPIESILLNKKNIILNVGENETLDASIFPTDTNNKNLIWNSSDESIATISNTGNLYGIKVGKCKITVYSEENPNIYDTCEIEIKQPVNSLRLDKNEIVSDKIGEIIQLNAIIEPSDATNKNVSWQSSNPSVCSVSSNGSVIILSEGTSVIIATTEDGGFVAICIVNVSFSTGIEIISINNSKNRYFSLDGKEVINPQKGNMYIIIDKNGYSQKIIFK